MTSDKILKKIKYLLSLANSDNINEAENAKQLAQQLIDKHNVTEEELNAKEYSYTDNKLCSTSGEVSWIRSLALIISKHLECTLVQEIITLSLPPNRYDYFIHGDPDKANQVIYSFNIYIKAINEVSESIIQNKDNDFIKSYFDGLITGVRENIFYEGLNLAPLKTELNQLDGKQTAAITTINTNLVAIKTEKEKPDIPVTNTNQTMIKNVVAYFKGQAIAQSKLTANKLNNN